MLNWIQGVYLQRVTHKDWKPKEENRESPKPPIQPEEPPPGPPTAAFNKNTNPELNNDHNYVLCLKKQLDKWYF